MKILKKKRKWYIAYVMPKTEKKIMNLVMTNEECIINRVKVLFPKETIVGIKKGKKKIIEEPLFYNYVIFKMPNNLDLFRIIECSPHVLYFLKDKNTGKPIPLTKQEKEKIKEAMGAIKSKSYEHLIGKKVYVTKGPFKGEIGICQCLIRGKGRNQACVEINILGNEKAKVEAEINLDYLEEYV